MELERKLEAILFWKGEPMSVKRLAEILSSSAKASDGQGKVGQKEIEEALVNLEKSLESRGIVLQRNNGEITLGTSPEFSKLIEDLQKEELNKELSKASLETLSIILYKNGANRAEIDYIRGVNSSFTLRALSIRGLVEKTLDPADNRRYLYKPSFELLSYMGIKSVAELPDFESVSGEISSAAKSLTYLSAKEAEESKMEEK